MVLLENNPLFSGLPAAEIESLCRFARQEDKPAGTVIFKEGDQGDGLYVVKQGLVNLMVSVGPNNAQSVFRARAGDIFGEMAVLEEKPRSAGAVAAEDTVVYFLPREALLSWLDTTPAGSRVLLREISRRLREFNQQYARDVIQAERLAVIGRFARSIVHDLKNPLNVIGLTAEVACMERATAADRIEAAARIRRQIERISSLIGEILEFTQSTGGGAVLTASSYRDFVSKTLNDLALEMEARGVQLVLENLPPEVPMLLDARRMRRVFSNLTHNAADFLPSGGKIMVRFLEEGSEVLAEVEDTGPGIAEEIRERLFEPFSTHGKAHGTGLGLSICQRILSDHGGWIRARQEPGRGAIFVFGIPKAGA